MGCDKDAFAFISLTCFSLFPLRHADAGINESWKEGSTKLVLVVAVCVLAVSTAAMGGMNYEAAVTVHVMEHASRSCTKGFPSIVLCEDIVTTYEGHDADCFPVFYWLTECQGLEYGLNWPGTYSCVFTSCSDFTIGDIVNAGDGISHAWSECKEGWRSIPGWAWIYEPGEAEICVVEHPEAGGINIGDCHEGMDQPEYDPFCAGIGGAEGEDPCQGGMANQQPTWGGIKSLFQ